MENNSIWIIDDDTDDQELIQEIMRELNVDNKVVFFSNS